MAVTDPSPVTGPQDAMIIVEGIYQGKDLNVQNPYTSNGGFCVNGLYVNEYKTTVGIDSSALEINFAQFQLKIGGNAVVKIHHHKGCTPKALNPEVLKSNA